eukprot:810444-Rhodomonas_salina.1
MTTAGHPRALRQVASDAASLVHERAVATRLVPPAQRRLHRARDQGPHVWRGAFSLARSLCSLSPSLSL